MKRLTLYFLLFTIFAIAMKCEEEPVLPNPDPKQEDPIDSALQVEIDKLPPITTSGAGTWAYLINGEAVILGKDIGDSYNATFSDNFIHLFSSAYHFDSTKQRNLLYKNINIRKFIPPDTGKYNFYTNEVNLLDWDSGGCSYSGHTEVFLEGQLNVLRNDTVNCILSATFEFLTYFYNPEKHCPDTFLITHGRVDMPNGRCNN